VFEWINRHGLETMAAYVIYSSAVQSLPKPDGCGKFYTFFYGFAHAIAANWGLVGKAVQAPQKCDTVSSAEIGR
jgi:hypothetical protein